MKAIINGKIILKDRIVENSALIFSDVIEGVVSAENIPEDAKIIDANGGYVSPGLIDMHIHGYLGKDVCDGEEESIRTISKGLLANGVTGYLPTTMTVDMKVIKKALEVCRELKEESKTWQGSTILGCHAEGPFISESKKGAQDARYILKPDAAFVKEYADIIKTITLAPETDENDFAAIREICRDTDVVVSMGHTSADYETAMASVNAGVKHVTHLFNAMTPLQHRAPGVVTAAMNSDISCELIVDTFHVDASLYDLLYKLKGRKLCFITDCLPAGGLPEGEYTLGGQKIIYKGIVCRLEDGTVAGSILRLNKGVWNVYTNSSIPLYECVNCASLNVATTLGIEKNKGSLEIGKDADIIITDNEFNVQKTIIGGTVKYEA
ncbi:MAG: N-acetylglucosamine-6-phosphate deacetylase [Acutalibacteraceae bacterium]|nr:N-acetylglucosamine-6-phosphate deacetylase [Acutalibacteraceae bacterium]